MFLRVVFICTLCAAFIFADAQEAVIKLTNASFEDTPRPGRQPRGWYNCGHFDESPPDVQPNAQFRVEKPAYEGETYLGMVVRDNETFEAVGQRLKSPLKAGVCYEFKLALARSQYYVSLSRTTNQEVNYTTGAVLRIWGGNDEYCHKAELLAESGRINNSRWMENEFKLEPSLDYNYITIEAYYVTPTMFPYNGNILIDNASDINPIPCDQEELFASNDEPKVNVKPNSKPKPQAKPKKDPVVEPKPEPVKPEPVPDPVVAVTPKPKVLTGLDKKTLREGQTIRIDQLYFEADTFGLTEQSLPVLEELYGFMNDNREVVLEIGGHTNGTPEHDFCDWLSGERAKAVVNYLIEKGIVESRLKSKGYGKRKPVASNKTRDGRKKNQRVEIKVLSLGG